MKVVIIDDDKMISMSLKIILEETGKVEVIGTGKDGAEALALYENLRPDILLMDIRMEKTTGLEGARQVLEKYPQALVLFLTTFSDDEYIIQALHMGARGYLLKQDFESILPALYAVMSGQSVFGGSIISKIPTLMPKKKTVCYQQYGISDKEWELVELVADGLSNKEIASRLCLSEGTVRNYLSTILEKLELRDRTQLAVFYYQNQ